jgi:GTP-binding protein
VGAQEDREKAATDEIRLAVLGKPNVGKSSLCNALLGHERVVVDDQPGTTRDPVDTPFSWEGRRFLLIDTAGIRRRRLGDEPAQQIAVQKALRVIERADVAVLVVDATVGPTEQDARLAGLVADGASAAVVVLNKCDLLRPGDRESLRTRAAEELRFLDWAPVLFTSARTGENVTALLRHARRAHGQYSRRIPTAQLNRAFEELLDRNPPPSTRGRPIKLYYVTQTQVRPPTFVISTNHPQAVPHAYRRYLQNQIRTHFGFAGTGIRLILRQRK